MRCFAVVIVSVNRMSERAQRFALLLTEPLRRRRKVGRRWYVDET